MNSFQSVLLVFAAFTASANCIKAQTDAAPCAYHYSQETISVAGHNVMVESYRPNGPGLFPLVFMLHGSAGAFTPPSKSEPARDNFGEKTLARGCFTVVLPHYIEAIGHKSLASRQEIDANLSAIVVAVGILLDRAEALQSVHGEPVFLFGESLATQAILHKSRPNLFEIKLVPARDKATHRPAR